MGGEAIHLLLVEDDPDDLLLMKEMLSEMDRAATSFRLETCNRLEAALERLPRGGLDAILLDLSLPDSHGLETVSRVRAAAPAIPLIVLTGLDDAQTGIQAIQAGAQDYLTKGHVTGKLLIQVIRYAIERKHLDQIKDEFIGSASHELRTPLTVVGLEIKSLLEGMYGSLSEKQIEVLARTRRNLDRLSRLIYNMLDFSRLRSGRVKAAFGPVPPSLLIHDVAKNFEVRAAECGVIVEKVVGEGLPAIQADGDLMQQVLMNLLDNALRYAQKKVVIAAEPVGESGGVPGAFVRFGVRDDGKGISQEGLRDLFGKFVQMDRAKRVGSYKGTGLGLAICKEIIELHDGRIWAESEEGAGARFFFTVPQVTKNL